MIVVFVLIVEAAEEAQNDVLEPPDRVSPDPFSVDLVGDGVLRKLVFIDVSNQVQCTQLESRKITGVANPAVHLQQLLLRAGDIEANPGANCSGCTMMIRGDVIALQSLTNMASTRLFSRQLHSLTTTHNHNYSPL